MWLFARDKTENPASFKISALSGDARSHMPFPKSFSPLSDKEHSRFPNKTSDLSNRNENPSYALSPPFSSSKRPTLRPSIISPTAENTISLSSKNDSYEAQSSRPSSRPIPAGSSSSFICLTTGESLNEASTAHPDSKTIIIIPTINFFMYSAFYRILKNRSEDLSLEIQKVSRILGNTVFPYFKMEMRSRAHPC